MASSSFTEQFIEDFQKHVKRLPIPVREVCPKTQRKCKRRGGSCVSLSSPCNTYASSNFCLGGSCTCCFGDHEACTTTPACSEGFCFRGKKSVCRGGKIVRSGCKGKRCSCCLLQGSQGQCSCGQSNGNRIVGGQIVLPPNKYPWLVGLWVPHLTKKYYCGGTIISPEFVITAGHCLFNHYTGEVFHPSEIKLRVGDYDQSAQWDDVQGVTMLVDVKEIILYDLFVVYRAYHDIGLIRLAKKLDLKSHSQIRAACLPPQRAPTYEGLMGTAYGWGVLHEDDSNLQDIPQEVTVPILGPGCKDKHFGDVIFTSNMLCAGLEEGGKDTCLGDSGGPFTVEIDNAHVLVGITSFGKGCGRPSFPGVYTRVSAYMHWILSKVKDACSKT